jgi:DNA-binding LacI/PurR family transcriptional regulator
MDILAVAKRAGVSTATVSRVINSSSKVREETAQRVREAIEELQYVPNTSARSLRSGRTNLFGLLVSDIRNPFFPDLIEHFESLAGQHGIDVTFVNTGYNEDRFKAGVQRLMERGVDGIAILTSEVSQPAVEKLREVGIPVVFLNQPTVTGEFRNITVDYVKGFFDAVGHLRMLGHERIGFVAGPPTLSSAARRRKSFLMAMKQAGLTIDESLVFEGDHKITGGQFAAERVFSMSEPPTALICSNDMTAVGVLHTAHRLGKRVPEDLSLVGFDDLFLTEIVQPALTTLHLSRREIATRAFYALTALRDQTGGPQTSVLLPQLVVRESTSAVSRKR